MSAEPSFRPKPHALEAIFGRSNVVIGMVHSRALPGSAAYDGQSMDELVGFSLVDAERLQLGGVLTNAAHQASAVAKASGATSIRVNQWANAHVSNEGLLDGLAGSATRYRAFLHAREVRGFADVHVKHEAHAITADRTVAELARDIEFFDADVAVITGQRTGETAEPSEIEAIAQGCSLPVVIGCGVIVASWQKHDGVWWNEVDPDRLVIFMAEANRACA